MLDDISDIQSFYDTAVEKEVDRLERHQLERDITWRYLDMYLPPTGKILDIGAATGAYTIPLARRGYSVTSVELSPVLLDVCRRRIIEEGLERNVTCLVADARNLTDVPGSDFDIVLLMGPMYHLVYEEDRKTVLKEVFKRLKSGGIVFSAFLSRYGIWGDVMARFPDYIEDLDAVQSVLKEGTDPGFSVPGWEHKFRAYFAIPSEISTLHEEEGFRTLVLAGVEPVISMGDDIYNRLEGTRRKLWLDLLFSLSTEESVIGASRHLLYIGVKEQ